MSFIEDVADERERNSPVRAAIKANAADIKAARVAGQPLNAIYRALRRKGHLAIAPPAVAIVVKPTSVESPAVTPPVSQEPTAVEPTPAPSANEQSDAAKRAIAAAVAAARSAGR